MAAFLKLAKSAVSSTNSLAVEPPLDQRTLDTLASRREATDNVNNALRSYHKTLGKQRSVRGEKTNALPLFIMGQEMLLAASAIGDKHGLFHCKKSISLTTSLISCRLQGQQLKNVGTAQIKLGELTSSFLDSFDSHLVTLEAKGIEHSDFVRTLKETEKRRDTYDSALVKARKSSRKEEGEELINARVSYEDFCMTLERKADALRAGSEQEQRDLEKLMDLQVGT